MQATSLPAATRAEKRRFIIMAQDIGCINHLGTPAQIHHLLSCGNRISHIATIPLCSPCHDMTHSARLQFIEDYASDAQLLSRTNREVARFEDNTIGGSGG